MDKMCMGLFREWRLNGDLATTKSVNLATMAKLTAHMREMSLEKFIYNWKPFVDILQEMGQIKL